MSMLPEVHHSSWIELRSGIAMRYEIDHDNELAIIYFGHSGDYVITLGKDTLSRLVDIGVAAREEFTSAPPP